MEKLRERERERERGVIMGMKRSSLRRKAGMWRLA